MRHRIVKGGRKGDAQRRRNFGVEKEACQKTKGVP